ncbi:hypothetical protein [Pontibacillus salipaludis]|uniref:Holin n=1 Tax=Pontibacillus salipaludis TaxID=1697394 RepID=A0ABQ1Q013_9BACI|nr:hypothetical protein [Pontibacillus salipaludis]GGD08492.1 hypothetical protein GCM10011389_15120 [Pontibacillus salipaludis]
MEHFPVIHTNFWDAVIAVPLVIILTQLLKKTLPIPKAAVPTVANIVGLVISIFFAHPNNIVAGFFMGFFYGNAAVGGYASLKTSLIAFRKKRQNAS